MRAPRLRAWLAALALLPLAARAEVPLPDPLLEGLEAGVAQRLVSAREALASALADAKVEPLARGRLYGKTGKIFHAQHVFAIAEACYKNAAELDPTEPLWSYLLGYVYADTARLEEARKAYRRVLELDPGHTLATLRLAQVELELGEIADAEKLLAGLDGEGELAAPVHAALGKIATARGDDAEAARHYQAALAAQPGASQLHYPLALAYRRLGEVEQARRHAALSGPAKLIVPDPTLAELDALSSSAELFLTSGAQALKAGRLDLAEQAFRDAVAADPENQRAHLNLAGVLAERGELDAAEASAREALRIDPDYGFAYFSLGTIFERRGQLGEAVGLFEQALARDPANLKLNFRLANALMRRGDFERAAERYRAVVEIAPGLVRARYLESLALIALERYSAAREVLEQAVEIDPKDQELSGSLARLLATAEPPSAQDAERALGLARALEQGNPEHAETLAMALAAAGRFDEAAATQQALIDAARGRGEPALVRHLEHNLERYRRGQASDQPWLVNEAGSDGSP